MQLTPRYDDPAFFRVDLPIPDPAVPLLRQRRRLAGVLQGLESEQWKAPSRCEGWSVKDVVSHLASTNQFWAFSIGAALGGEPTRFLATFDPVASPAQLVDATSSQSHHEVLDQFVSTNDALADAVARIDDDGWSVLGEAPPGHVPLRTLALHALWDSWIHERDVLVPLGLAPDEEPDEVLGSLAYGAALSPGFRVTQGSTRPGAVVVDATDPDVHVVVEVGTSVRIHTGVAADGALHLTGSAVELVDALSFRAPLRCDVPDEHAWLLTGLAEVFDRP